MKPKLKRLGRKLLSVTTVLSILAALVCTPALTSLTADAGATINILTGRWGAVAMEYLERGIMRTIGSAAAHAENEAVADILTTTKKFLASPMSSTLGDIRNMCAQMNAKLDNIASMISNNQNILENKLDAITEQTLKDNYSNKKESLDRLKNVYANVINLFHKLNEKAQAVDLDKPDTINELRKAYDDLNDIYDVANGITTHTGLEFNFSTDADTIAGLISAYPYSAKVDYNYDPSDKSVWDESNKSDVPTMIDYYYQSLKYSDAFDHEYYRDMSAQYTYAAGVVSNYLEAYNLYVSYAAQLIYSGQVSDLTSDRDKQKEVDRLWDGYNQKCYVLLRALSQMMDGYDSKLSGAMREYDINTTIHFDNIKESILGSGYSEDSAFGKNDPKTSNRNKTSNRMQAYQLRPFGSTKAYALRKSNSSQKAIYMQELSYYAFDYRVSSPPWYQNECNGYTCDYYNLMKSGATSPTGWNTLTSNSDLNGLVNNAAFEKVYSTAGSDSNIVKYLKLHNINSDLPKMDSSNPYTLSSKYEWNPNSSDWVGNWDIDMLFFDITSLKKGSSMSSQQYDMDDDQKKFSGKEVSIFYTGEPQVAVYLPQNGGAQYQYSAVDYKGKAASANGGRNVFKSGGTVTLRIKPDEGKYIKSLRLCDRFVYDEDHSKGTLTQYVSDNEDNGDALYKADCGLYPDSDGYYTFKINVPFRDGSVILDLADIPAKLHTVTLAESEDVVSGDQYDKDGGILLFSNFSGESSKNVNAGDTVSTAVIPYTGYTCKGLEIKDASGKTYSYSKTDSSEYYSIVHGQNNFSFTMPDTDVTVKAVYEKGYNVELIHSILYPNAVMHFINENGTVDDNDTIRTYIPGDRVNIEATAINGHVVSEITVSDLTNRNYVPCDMTENGVSFVMPAGNVRVETKTQKEVVGTYLVGTAEGSEVSFDFLNDDDTVRNVPTILAEEGETVRFTAIGEIPENYELNVSAQAENAGAVEVTDNGDQTYSLTMPASNVTITGALIDAPERHTATIVNFVNGTASFSKDKEVLTVKAEPYEYVNFYVTTDRNNCFKSLKVTDSKGKDVSYQKSAYNVIDGDKIIYSLKFQMEKSDITIEGEMTESLVVTPDSSKFVYNDSGEAIAYIEIADYLANHEYSKEAVRIPSYANTIEGRFVYDETHFPTHLKVVGETTGTVFYDSDQDATKTTFLVHTQDLTQFGENLIVIPSFGSTEDTEPVSIGIRTYQELASFSENLRHNYSEYKNANVWLENNIIASQADGTWVTSIGTEEQPFEVTFDGKGYAVIGLRVKISENGGLFGCIGENGLVKDLIVADCDFTQTSKTAGGIAAINNGTIDHCISGVNANSGKVIYSLGGDGSMANQYNSYVNGNTSGGIAGVNNGTITGSRSSAAVVGSDCGGIVCTNKGTIYGCANNGSTGKDSVTVKRCGGIAVENNGTIASSYNSGKENCSAATPAQMGSVVVDNCSSDVHDVFYVNSGTTAAYVSGTAPLTNAECTLMTINDMLDPAFADTLNSVTDDTVTWKTVAVNSTYLNKGFPVVVGPFLVNRTIDTGSNISLSGLMHSSMKAVYSPLTSGSAALDTMYSAAPDGYSLEAYDITVTDESGNVIPAGMWCAGVQISVPVDDENSKIIIIDSDGEAQIITPDRIEGGKAVFSVAEPVAFAVAKTTSSGSNYDNNDGQSTTATGDSNIPVTAATGDSSIPVTAAAVMLVISAAVMLAARKKREHE